MKDISAADSHAAQQSNRRADGHPFAVAEPEPFPRGTRPSRAERKAYRHVAVEACFSDWY